MSSVYTQTIGWEQVPFRGEGENYLNILRFWNRYPVGDSWTPRDGEVYGVIRNPFKVSLSGNFLDQIVAHPQVRTLAFKDDRKWRHVHVQRLYTGNLRRIEQMVREHPLRDVVSCFDVDFGFEEEFRSRMSFIERDGLLVGYHVKVWREHEELFGIVRGNRRVKKYQGLWVPGCEREPRGRVEGELQQNL